MHQESYNMDEHLEVIQSTYKRSIDLIGIESLSKIFFDNFFETYPETIKFFNGTDTAYFGPKKLSIIFEFLTDIIKHPNYAEGQITQEVIRHQMYGLADKEYYCTLIDSLHYSVKLTLNHEWNNQCESVWNDITLVFKGHVSASVDAYT